MNWRKSSYSGGEGNCVEIGHDTGVHVRDTKQADQGPVLRFTPEAWRKFADRVKGDIRLSTDAVPQREPLSRRPVAPFVVCRQ